MLSSMQLHLWPLVFKLLVDHHHKMCFVIINDKFIGCHVICNLVVLLGERVGEGSWVSSTNTICGIIYIANSPTTIITAGLGILVINRVLVYQVRNVIGK